MSIAHVANYDWHYEEKDHAYSVTSNNPVVEVNRL
jgi:hypothetical protein